MEGYQYMKCSKHRRKSIPGVSAGLELFVEARTERVLDTNARVILAVG